MDRFLFRQQQHARQTQNSSNSNSSSPPPPAAPPIIATGSGAGVASGVAEGNIVVGISEDDFAIVVVVFDDVVGISEDDFAIVVVVFDDVVGISEDDFAVVVVVHVFDDVSVADGCGDAVLLISFPEPDSYSETQCVWTVHNRV